MSVHIIVLDNENDASENLTHTVAKDPYNSSLDFWVSFFRKVNTFDTRFFVVFPSEGRFGRGTVNGPLFRFFVSVYSAAVIARCGAAPAPPGDTEDTDGRIGAGTVVNLAPLLRFVVVYSVAVMTRSAAARTSGDDGCDASEATERSVSLFV